MKKSILFTLLLHLTLLGFTKNNPGRIGAPDYVCKGTKFTVSNTQLAIGYCALESATVDYEWEKSSNGMLWTPIVITNPHPLDDYTLIGEVILQTTYYRRIAIFGPTSGCPSEKLYSNTVMIKVEDDLDGATISGNQTVCYNGDAERMKITTHPEGISELWRYEWQNSTDNGNTWEDVPDIGYYYTPESLTQDTKIRLKTTNNCVSKYSNEITIDVRNITDGGEITGDQTICYGGNPTTINNGTIAHDATGSYTCSWEESIDDRGTWNAIEGATTPIYAPGALTTTTMYRRLWTDVCGTFPSNTVTITVRNEVDGGVIGEDQTLCPGETSGSINNTQHPSGGIGDWTYQWEQSLNNGTTWSAINGETNLSLDPGQVNTQKLFRRIASNTCGSEESNTVFIQVSNALDGGIIGDELHINLCYNEEAGTLSNTATPTGGHGTWQFEWQVSLNGGNTYQPIENINTPYYDPGKLTATTRFRRLATNNCGSTLSNSVYFTVGGEIEGGSIAGTQAICKGGTPTPLTSSEWPSGGYGVPEFQWQESTNGGSSWSTIDGADHWTYLPPTPTTSILFRRIVTNSCGSAPSNNVGITVASPVDGGIISGEQVICSKSHAAPITNVSPASGGIDSWSYRWQKSIDDGENWINIINAYSTDYTPRELNQTGQFRRLASNSCGEDYSNTISIEVLEELDPGTISSDQEIPYNTFPEEITGSIPAGGSGEYTYAWQYSYDNSEWLDYHDSETTNYQPESLIRSIYLRRNVSDYCETLSSNVIQIQVLNELKPGAIGSDQTLCHGETPETLMNLDNPTGGGDNLIFNWQYSTDSINWTPIPETNAAFYQPEELTQTRYYRRGVSCDGYATVFTKKITLDVQPIAEPPQVTAKGIYCNDEDVEFRIKNDNQTSYTWTEGISTHNGSSFIYTGDKSNLNVQVYSINMHGCHSDTSIVNTIIDKSYARFTASDTNANLDEAIQFLNLSTSDSDSIYVWSFGDGSTSNLKHPHHSYQNTGLYDVSLIVLSKNQCMYKVDETGFITISNPEQNKILATGGINNQLGIKIYPTVSTDYITIDSRLYDQNNRLQIILYNNLGQQVLSKTLVSGIENEIDVSNLKQGTYIVVLKVNDLVSSSKIVVD